ncbi:TRAP transporter permease [Pelagibacterium xiamenense]|uniref:TRAP transporter permease n=1 Tax=Pelagibacterium xiamenense TaxID=2901140 RepID=UPI001E61CBDD|nr:TRAP transporter permease [Pelagibacterium xiamenense]MCD7060645.1 TRAP transporter permease [Pelagibacterium xiamenense]
MQVEQHAHEQEVKDKRLGGFPLWITRAFTVAILVLAVNQIFNLGFLAGFTLLENRYLYAILAFALPLIFIYYRANPNSRAETVPLYDWALSAIAFATCGYFFANGLNIVMRGWEMAPPDQAVWVSGVLWVLVVEAGRRAGGTVLAAIVGILSLYPIFAGSLPGPISAFPAPLDLTAAYHAMSSESILGVAFRSFANLIVGFIIFGAALQHTGAGKFFIDLAFALLGHVRGGPAKVAIFSSGLMGSMSGSVVTNVLTTGPMTIAAMKRTGMKGTFAAGVETAASTGGVLMPPVMGATAFVMANLLGVPYADIALAAIIPSVLFFFGLFIQIDARAAKEELKGLPRAELPKLGETLREGWYYLFAFGLLIFMLLVLKRETIAPFFAAPALIIINQLASRKHRWGWAEFGAFIDSLGRLFANLIGILAAVGLIIGALSVTGLAGTLVNDLLRIAGGSSILLLIMGAITSLILGVGMTSTAAYIFLAILLAPALISSGLNAIAAHMFIFYWGMLSFITPPVALGAFAAASVARTPPMRTGFEAMKLGSVIYFIPFFFVFQPALVLQGTPLEAVVALGLAAAGILIFAGAMQGYLLMVGPLFTDKSYSWPLRLVLIAGALIMAVPADAIPGWTDFALTVLALVFIAPVILLALAQNHFWPANKAQTN